MSDGGLRVAWIWSCLAAMLSASCSQVPGTDLGGIGGTTLNSGGATAGGGTDVGGDAAGGSPAGGTSNGATSSGGSSTGGSASGGSSSGGNASGGTQNFEPVFILGADISGTQESSATYVDTDGETKSLFALLQNHGFNYVRLRTFVDPSAPGGYASDANGCTGLPESFGDKDHVIAYGQEVKTEGMGLLIDFHYSDVWTDPGNQIIPSAWRDAPTTEALADLVYAYTKDFLEDAIAAGARPDMVQIGNEITPGMLVHLPGQNTDCWGNNPGSVSPIGGGNSTSAGWDRLAILLGAGLDAVRDVDPTIRTMLHVENTDDLDGVLWWASNAVDRGLDFDVFGLSCYTEFQGPPSVWETTFEALAAEYPELEFVIAEYNPERTAANTLVKNLSGGLGTFFWEPTRSGEWGEALFTWQSGAYIADPEAFAEYDALLPTLGL